MAEDSKRFGIYIKTQFDGKGFDDADKRGGDSAKTAGDNAKKMSDEYRASFDAIGKGAAVAFAAMAAGIGFSVNAFGKQEDALNRARSAVEITGKSWSEFNSQVRTTAAGIQEFTRYGDEDLIGMFADMVLLSGNAAASLENMGLAADVAAGLHMDLGSASRYLGMALAGETGMLSRYVPALRTMNDVLGENATQQEKAAFITEKLRQSFGGLAQQEALTMTGSIKQATNAAGDAAENLGAVFAPAVVSSARAMKEAAFGAGEWIKNHQSLVRVMGEFALASTGWIAATVGISLAIAKIPAIISSVGMAFTWLAANPAGLIIAALGAVALAAKRVNDALLELSTAGSSKDYWGKLAKEMTEAGASGSDLHVIMRQITTVAQENGISLQMAAQQILELDKKNGNVIQSTNEWLFSLIKANTALDTQAEKVKINASALRDLMNAGLSAAEALKMAKMPVIGEQAVETTSIEMGPEYGPEQRYQLMVDAAQKAADEQKRIWDASYQSFQFHTQALTGTYAAAMQTITDTEMTGKQRREAIWKSFIGNAVGYIINLTQRYVFEAIARSVADKTAAAAGLAATAAQVAAEKPLAASSAASWMSVAYAKALAFFAFSGPFAPGLAAAVTGAGLGVMAGQGAAAGALVLGFARGGIVPGYGYSDSVPAMLTPGERVISREVYSERRTQIENAIAGRGGGNTFHITVPTDRHLSHADIFDIVRQVKEMLPRAIEDIIDNGSLRPGYSLGKA